MKELSQHIGSRIRMYRRVQGMSLQELAARIHKSRASVSKYENGEVVLDVETLYEISRVLHVELCQLTDLMSPQEKPPVAEPLPLSGRKSPFYEAKRLYFYFYDGRYRRLKDGIIDIFPSRTTPGSTEASFSISSITGSGRSSESLYSGSVTYSDMLIRFSFVNQLNPLEEDLLYIFNPLELRDYSEGLLCGISSADFMPCAFKCLVTLSPQEADRVLRQQLMITTKDVNRWKKLNMMLIDNHGN